MENIRILKSKDYLRLPWKNGQGHTNQIAISPAGSNFASGDFLWRLSTASITSAGPFSLFPQHQRILAIIQGHGIEIMHEEKKMTLPAFTAHQFSGAVSTRSELPYGPVVDFNLFWRDEQVSIQLEIITLQRGDDFLWKTNGKNNFLFLAEGRVQAGKYSMEHFDTLHGTGETRVEIQPLTMTARAISIALAGVSL